MNIIFIFILGAVALLVAYMMVWNRNLSWKEYVAREANNKDYLYWHGKSVQELSKKEMKEALEWAFEEIQIERELHEKTRNMAGITLGDVLYESVTEKKKHLSKK